MKAFHLFALLVCATVCFAGQHAPLPPALMSAKTLYIENNSGQANLADRCYDELSKWGRFKIVSDRQYRPGHFLIECRIMDGDRLWAVGHVELEILFKGRAFDALIGKPPQSR